MSVAQKASIHKVDKLGIRSVRKVAKNNGVNCLMFMSLFLNDFAMLVDVMYKFMYVSMQEFNALLNFLND